MAWLPQSQADAGIGVRANARKQMHFQKASSLEAGASLRLQEDSDAGV